ncbi:ABC transporter substrate-binding protein [Roseisalinus antarcticus]|uniref:Putative D,D-dipeptide-binding periplasmic protein DdpA n=1 Tax=Roseisalinus antarcticus TaxID=254357 RepID=A0A1Y5TTJ3_9RHOB|nr:ABC transporter substrate-binding protein [Roseisalinus antarcticus]SLN72144.1 putative D,D-dipeptide-binding periplasmic protein DdpA precursor [Roseisalinus antarcticus]
MTKISFHRLATSTAVALALAAGPAMAQDGTLSVALAGDIDNFDPATNQLIAFQAAIGNTVFDPLIGYDADLNLVPRLAASWEVNEDATEFTLTLQDGATFHDGTPVTAEAVIASLQRSAELGGVIGTPLQRVTAFEAVDDSTLKMTLEDSYAPFLTALTVVFILAPDSFDDATSAPIGSGPFVFESWTPNDAIVLSRNDAYWGEKPAFETLQFRPVPDSQVALTNLYAGDIDIVAEPSNAVLAQVDTSAASVVRPSASNSVAYVEMMGTTGTLSDPAVRRALAHAFDREAVQLVAYSGGGESNASPLPTSSWAYEDLAGYGYDLDAAAAALEEAGVSDLTVGLEIPAGFPEGEQMARVWQSSLAEIGVDLEINVSEISVWLDAYVSRNYDMTWNFFGVSPDPHSFFDVILRPHFEGDVYDNPRVAELVAAGIATGDRAEREEIYSELQQIVVDEVPVMTVQSRPVGAVASNGVEGFAMNPLGWGLYTGVTLTE